MGTERKDREFLTKFRALTETDKKCIFAMEQALVYAQEQEKKKEAAWQEK